MKKDPLHLRCSKDSVQIMTARPTLGEMQVINDIFSE